MQSILKTGLTVAGLLAGLVGLTACEELVCDTMAVSSVQVSVVDESGALVEPTTLTYQVDGGEILSADCMVDDCSEAVAGWEVAGDFTITATYEAEDPEDPSCWYSDDATVSVTVEQDGCHVISESVELVLDTTALACP